MLRYLADQTILAVCICLLHTARIIWSVLLTFLATLMVNSIKKVRESFWCSCSITCKGKRTDWILKIFTFNNKNPLYLPLISTLQFFEGQRHKGLTQLATESFGMPQWRIVSLSLKNARFFPKSFHFSFFLSFFLTIPHLTFETNPPPLIINVVCKYLEDWVGEGTDLYLNSGTS